jgi:hypothetical protein
VCTTDAPKGTERPSRSGQLVAFAGLRHGPDIVRTPDLRTATGASGVPDLQTRLGLPRYTNVIGHPSTKGSQTVLDPKHVALCVFAKGQ